jgi:D-arabinose 1-dehydrogenase-like Zn-dependent alcohol dehydrogenase
MTQLLALTLAEFVDAVGQDQPVPGCGGAGAVALALGAACARKAFVISARRRGGDSALEAAAERCRVISEAAVQDVQRDADEFRALLKAGPADQAPLFTLETDGQVYLALAAELRVLLERHADEIDHRLSGDAVAALTLTQSFERIQSHNLAEL